MKPINRMKAAGNSSKQERQLKNVNKPRIHISNRWVAQPLTSFFSTQGTIWIEREARGKNIYIDLNEAEEQIKKPQKTLTLVTSDFQHPARIWITLWEEARGKALRSWGTRSRDFSLGLKVLEQLQRRKEINENKFESKKKQQADRRNATQVHSLLTFVAQV